MLPLHNLHNLEMFPTGSRVYGTPRADSDVDVCVLVRPEQLAVLRTLADPETPRQLEERHGSMSQLRDLGADPGDSLRFGKLNMICLGDQRVFDAWAFATDVLYAARPVRRDVAIDIIKKRVAYELKEAKQLEHRA